MSYPHIAALGQDLLFLFLLVVAPLWDYRDTRRLKQSPNSAGKILYYKTLCAWQWTATAVALLAVGVRPLFTISRAPDEASWLFEHAWVRYLIGSVLAIFMALILLPAAVAIWKNVTNRPRKYSSADAVKSLSYFFPATWTERRWYAFLCVTAGICEETLFRGFLLHYLHVLPFSLNLTLALLVSSGIFGLQHLYLGAAGAASLVVIGLLFGLLFLLTGNLLIPVVFHSAMDLRMLLLLRPPAAAETA
ncbi:MAG: CPBP family intramembrane glutamic endopeptidase [Candidatus Acidiferrales bacterium]